MVACQPAPQESGASALSGNRQALHDLDAVAGKYREMRMIQEQFRGCILRLCLDDDEAGEIVPNVGDALRVDPLRLAERTAGEHDDALVLLHPVAPRLEALLLPGLARGLVELVPLLHVARRAGIDGHEI